MLSNPIVELKDKILSLAVSNPNSCNSAVRKMIRYQSGLKQIALTFDTIGFEYSRQIFDSIPKEQWEYLETVFYTCPETYSKEQTEQILKEVYQLLLSEVMTRQKMSESHSDADPFLFLRSLSDPDLKKLINQFHSVKIALISAYWHEHEMARILKQLEPEKRREVILQINRLQRLPEEFGLQAATSFAKEMEFALKPVSAPEQKLEPELESEPVITLDIPSPIPVPPPFLKSVAPVAEKIIESHPPEVIAAIERITARVSQKEERELLQFIERESPQLYQQVLSKSDQLS